jgi:endo-1,4-beta-xylanase
MLNRRHLLRALVSFTAASFASGKALANIASPAASAAYGSAVYLQDLQSDPRLADVLKRYCQRITPVSEMKWDILRPSAETYDFQSADYIADFARQNSLHLHGHPLIWYAANGDWLSKVTNQRDVSHLMEDHIATVVARYKDVARSWDVVNEPIPDDVSNERSRREAWYDYAGKNAIAKAFQLAHQADPSALLVLNEYDVEFAIEKSPMKLKAFRNLILDLLDQGAPLGAIGLQGHLRGNWPIATHELAAFTSEMRSLGLKIMVTELDVMDHELPSDPNERDQAVIKQVRDFLGAASADGPLHSITTWGISDQYTWIRWAYPRGDGSRNRPLPMDWDFREKPLMALINEFRKVK